MKQPYLLFASGIQAARIATISMMLCLTAASVAGASAFAQNSRINFEHQAQTVSDNDLLLKSASVDLVTDTVTLPLHEGRLNDGRSVWYVLTDVSDAAKAKELGLNFAPALAFATQAKSTRSATLNRNNEFTFAGGSVDFSPVLKVVPGDAPRYFPPKAINPGSVAGPGYSPFVTVEGIVYNAPVVAFNVNSAQIDFGANKADASLVHDKVVKLDLAKRTVTLALTHGFFAGRPILYLSFDSNVDLPASLEGVTFNPAESDLKDAGVSIPLYAVVNGDIGANNPDRQGFDSALHGDGGPLNILGGIVYSPLWSLHMLVWSKDAIANGSRKLIESEQEAQAFESLGLITAPGGGAVTPSGILVNCPIIAFSPQ